GSAGPRRHGGRAAGKLRVLDRRERVVRAPTLDADEELAEVLLRATRDFLGRCARELRTDVIDAHLEQRLDRATGRRFGPGPHRQVLLPLHRRRNEAFRHGHRDGTQRRISGAREAERSSQRQGHDEYEEGSRHGAVRHGAPPRESVTGTATAVSLAPRGAWTVTDVALRPRPSQR